MSTVQLRIPTCSQQPEAFPTPGDVFMAPSTQRLQLRRWAFHNSLFPDPHTLLTGPRASPCNPSHAPFLLFARCLLRPRMRWAMYLGPSPLRPTLPSHQGPRALPARTGTATLTSHPTHSHLATAARRCHLLRSHLVDGRAGVGVLYLPTLPTLPCLALPCLPACPPALLASMSSPLLMHTYSCGAFPLSGVSPRSSSPLLAGPQHRLLLDCHGLQI